MNDYGQLAMSIRRSSLLAAGVCVVLLAITIGSLAFALVAVWDLRDTSRHLPVLVVPGSVGGVYTPGLTDDSVRAVARYLVGLGTNFSGVLGMDERFDELERFSSPRYLPELQAARARLRQDVETQNQARVFFASPASEQLDSGPQGRFEYRVGGQRTVYASGLPMDTRPCTVRVALELGSTSPRNRAGVMLEKFEVVDGPPHAGRQASQPDVTPSADASSGRGAP